MQTKICSKCHKEKELSEFHKDKKTFDGLRIYCKDCVRLYKSEYDKNHAQKRHQTYLDNKDNVLKQSREWRKTHKEQHKNTNKKYFENHQEEIKKYRKDYYQENKERINKSRIIFKNNNINAKIAANLRTRIGRALKCLNKSDKTLNILGCTVEQFRKHLESQFKDGMSWENYGRGWGNKGMKEWHIDHKIPIDIFNLSKDSEKRICFHWSNLQPLWAKENLIKSNKHKEILK